MIGLQERQQRTLFIAGCLEDLIPGDHILKRVDKVLDLSWLRDEVRDCYCETSGRPGIDPEAALRLMLAGFFQGIVSDRKLMREAQVNLAIRWFAGYRLDDNLPDHSSLTRIRQRWGVELFKRVLHKTVEACVAANLVGGETVHVDATLIRADVSWESLTAQHVETVLEVNDPEESDEGPSGGSSGPKKGGRPRTRTKHPKKRSVTDPDATMATSRQDQKMEPSYKQHTAADDKVGVIVEMDLTTGEVNEGTKLLEAIEQVEARTGRKVERVTADASYAHSKNYKALEERGIDAIIPPISERKASRKIPVRRFKYDGKHQVVRCPGGRTLRRGSRGKNGWYYKARPVDCRKCELQRRCVSPGATARTILIVDGYEALLRARRKKKAGWDEETKRYYNRHRWRVEGAHGEAKTQHGLRRAIRRGLSNVAIQVYLTATVMNLKRLAALLWLLLLPRTRIFGHQNATGTVFTSLSCFSIFSQGNSFCIRMAA